MAIPQQEGLLDYEHDDTTNFLNHATVNGENGDILIDDEPDSVVDRKPTLFAGHVSLHSTGFQDMMLKPELLRAIAEAGFEHPSGKVAGCPGVVCFD